jgi:hypothetical protein
MQAEFKVTVKTYWNKSGDYELLDTSAEEGAEEQGLFHNEETFHKMRHFLN